MSLDSVLRARLEKAQQQKRSPFHKECCQDTNNLRYALELNNRPDLCVLRCKHCGAVHRRVYVEKGQVGVRGRVVV